MKVRLLAGTDERKAVDGIRESHCRTPGSGVNLCAVLAQLGPLAEADVDAGVLLEEADESQQLLALAGEVLGLLLAEPRGPEGPVADRVGGLGAALPPVVGGDAATTSTWWPNFSWLRRSTPASTDAPDGGLMVTWGRDGDPTLAHADSQPRPAVRQQSGERACGREEPSRGVA